MNNIAHIVINDKAVTLTKEWGNIKDTVVRWPSHVEQVAKVSCNATTVSEVQVINLVFIR